MKGAFERLTHRLGSVNINTTRSYSWPVSVSPSDLAKNNQYVFRFTPYGAQPPFNGSKVQQVSSAGFEIEGGVQPSSSAVTSASGMCPMFRAHTLHTDDVARNPFFGAIILGSLEQ
jgi:hypothetical protein